MIGKKHIGSPALQIMLWNSLKGIFSICDETCKEVTFFALAIQEQRSTTQKSKKDHLRSKISLIKKPLL